MLKRLRSIWTAIRFRRNFEDGMEEELRFHVETYAAELRRSGLTQEEAYRRARIEFGGVNGLKEDCRSSRGLAFFDEAFREMRYAARLLRKTPGFTFTAVAILGLCLGAHLTIFAVIDSVLIRPLPFPEAERLVTIYNTYPKAGVARDGSSLTNYYERRGHVAALGSVSIYRLGSGIVGENGASMREQVTQVSPEFFSTLGLGPAKGRVFAENETSYETEGVVVLSDAFWRNHFAADSRVLGKSVRLDGRLRTVVGVLPANFRFLSSDAQLYVPLASRTQDRGPQQRHSGGNVTQMIARLKPGVTVARAQAQIDQQNNALEVDNPQGKMMADAGFRSVVTPLHADHVAQVRPVLLLLEAAVVFLLLIGGVNLANLLLIRASARVKELAVRQALGASWKHVVSEVSVETMLLTCLGGFLGILVGAGGIRLLKLLGVDQLPLTSHLAFDGRLAAIALVATVATGIVLALPITWFHLRHQLASGLQWESRAGTAGRAAQTLRHCFVAAQIALAFVMLAATALLSVSLKNALAASPGFRTAHLLTGQISLVGVKYPAALNGLAFIERLAGALSHQPGVVAAGVTNNMPFSGYSGMSAAKVQGYVTRPGESPQGHYSYGVAGNYFDAMGLVLREGRFLKPEDSRRKQRVCVVDEDFARFYWPHESAVGHQLFQGSDATRVDDAFTVVGVVGRVKQAGLTDDSAQGAVYYPYIYRPDNTFYVTIRTSSEPQLLASTLRKTVWGIDPELAVSGLKTMDDRVQESLFVRRSPALLAMLFSTVALLLTSVGTYGVLSYAVAQRHREIGLRMALGARPEQIRRQFLAMAVRLLLIGLTGGAVGAWLMGRSLQAILFHVRANDVATLAAAGLVVAIVSLVACVLPAQRAARISPMRALSEG